MAENYIIVAKNVTVDMDDFLKEVNAKIDEGYILVEGLQLGKIHFHIAITVIKQ